MELSSILKQSKFTQVAMVVNDIEEASRNFGLLFGCAPAEALMTCGDFSVKQTKVFGELSPDVDAKLAFFDLAPGVRLELIEPNKAPSVWRDALDKYGEGIHHIAFEVEDAEETARLLTEQFGGKVEQQGTFGDGTGQYIYVDCFARLKCRFELLENFGK